MAAGDALVCPACGSLNKPKWEFCARCGESLQGRAPVKAGAVKAAAPESMAGDGRGGSSWALLGGGVLVLVGLAVAGLRYASQAPPPPLPDPSLFTLPRQPSAAPSAAAPGPGVKDFDEGRRLLAGGDVAGAQRALAAAVAADPGNADFHSVYAQVLWAAGAREDALKHHAEAARLSPQRYRAAFARALDMAEKGAEAVRAYEEVLAQEPKNVAIEESLGRLLHRLGEHAKAVPLLQHAVAARPDDPVLQQELAHALDKTGDSARAEEVYREVLRQAPAAAFARGQLAESLDRRGKHDEAIALLQEGIRAHPDSPLLHRSLGSILQRSGRFPEAVAAYKEYARLAPNAADAKQMAELVARLEQASGVR